MFSAALLMILTTPSEMPAQAVAKPAKTASKSCREMLLSSSRLGAVKICKTRAGWRRWEACHGSVTRYCTPKKKEDQLLSQWRGDRIICKDIKETGSRLSVQRVCSSAREWRLAEEEAQRGANARNMATKLFGGSEDPVTVTGFSPFNSGSVVAPSKGN